MSEENKALVRKVIDEVWSGRNYAATDELVASDYIGHSSSVETETHGSQGYRQFFVGLRAGFPDLEFSVDDLLAEGDRVVTRWTAKGTHSGDFAGVGPTGRQGAITGTTIYRIEQGQVRECWTHADDLGLMRLIGAIPTPVAPN